MAGKKKLRRQLAERDDEVRRLRSVLFSIGLASGRVLVDARQVSKGKTSAGR